MSLCQGCAILREEVVVTQTLTSGHGERAARGVNESSHCVSERFLTVEFTVGSLGPMTSDRFDPREEALSILSLLLPTAAHGLHWCLRCLMTPPSGPPPSSWQFGSSCSLVMTRAPGPGPRTTLAWRLSGIALLLLVHRSHRLLLASVTQESDIISSEVPHPELAAYKPDRVLGLFKTQTYRRRRGSQAEAEDQALVEGDGSEWYLDALLIPAVCFIGLCFSGRTPAGMSVLGSYLGSMPPFLLWSSHICPLELKSSVPPQHPHSGPSVLREGCRGRG
ncbi:thioredoxin domain-containing protein 16 [Lates japonicus]|uniref:Thioredoxin domain-containing protein 16 n=1 Tax=Lates japonicus TaxID=270547 RepID=A0AAD3MRB8_LATJO|nr:thioredoxin domain-containing protein 16 [Lates japonicus]